MPTAVTTADAAEVLYDANVIDEKEPLIEEWGAFTRYRESEHGLVRLGHRENEFTYDMKIEDFKQRLEQ